LMMLGEEDLALETVEHRLVQEQAPREELVFQPDRHGGEERSKSARRDAEVLLEQALELEQRLVVEADVVELASRQARLTEAVGRGPSGKPGVVLLAGEALFLRGRNDLAVPHHAGGGVVVEGGEAEDGRHGVLLELLAVARRVEARRATWHPHGAPAVTYSGVEGVAPETAQ